MVVFWQAVPLAEMTPPQWESLCDGCGKCCLNKLQDEDDETVYYTDVACRYLDGNTGQCSDYQNRLRNVPLCLNLTPKNLAECYWWLPPSCAYRRLAEGRGLAHWHPLIAGNRQAIEACGHSVIGRTISETDVDEEEWQERVVHWVTDEN